jgi:hypothetical protein
MHPRTILAITAGLTTSAAAHAQTFDLSWFTVDGGGATFSSGGGYTLGGTIGQPDAGQLAGGVYALSGGFWAAATAPPPCAGARGDANCDGSIDFFDIDPFLEALFDPVGYHGAFCGGSICAVDADCSGAVDFFDIDPFIACLFAACPACP